MHNSRTLISNYRAVDFWMLREAGRKPHPVDSPLSTHSLEYYVEYVTLSTGLDWCPGNQHRWNCITDGMPTKGALREWCERHQDVAAQAGYTILIGSADIRRCSDGEVICGVEL